MPPKVTRQLGGKKLASRSARKKEEEVINRITSVGDHDIAIRMNTYGRGKTGKTRFFSTWPKPALIIGTENGTLSVSTVKGLDFVQIKRSSEIEDLVDLLKEGKYKSVCLDHGGGLQDLVLQEVLDLEDIPVEKSWGMAKREDWQTCGQQTKERMRLVLSLAETHGIHVNIIAHERNFKEDGNDSDLIMPTVGSALQPSVANWLNGCVDYVCQCFIREETIVTKHKIGNKIKTTMKKSEKKEFCLRIGPHPVFMTGFRAPPEVVLPEVIVDPNFNKVMELVKGE
jgi:hypothetical protein